MRYLVRFFKLTNQIGFTGFDKCFFSIIPWLLPWGRLDELWRIEGFPLYISMWHMKLWFFSTVPNFMLSTLIRAFGLINGSPMAFWSHLPYNQASSFPILQFCMVLHRNPLPWRFLSLVQCFPNYPDEKKFFSWCFSKWRLPRLSLRDSASMSQRWGQIFLTGTRILVPKSAHQSRFRKACSIV